MKTEILKALTDVKAYWNLGCNYDGIMPSCSFVVWSKNNPYADVYSQALSKYIDLLHTNMIEEREKSFSS